MNPRVEAIKTLKEIDFGGAFSNLSTREVLSKIPFTNEDRGLYLNLVYGCLQNKIYLDYIIGKVATKPLAKLDKLVLESLRVAVYQIYFLDRIPDYAAVDQSVSFVAKENPKAKGFVNGVLRNILRKKDELGCIQAMDNEKEVLSLKYSVPLWLVHKYFEAYGGEEGTKIIESMNQTPPLTLRVNTLKNTASDLFDHLEKEGFAPKKGKLSKDAILLGETAGFGGELTKSIGYKKGWFTIQDQGAMTMVEALDPKAGEKVLDMCAAPGGKTTHIAQLMDNQGEIVARDIYTSRLNLIEDTAKRLGVTNIITQAVDGCILDPTEVETYDKILLDAPCSGTGIIRRKPEIRYTGDKKTRKAIRQIQKKLLENGVAMLKKGGTLVYSTCAVDSEENEKMIQWICKEHPELEMESQGYTNPLIDGSDCFFHCVLKKKTN